MKDNVRIVINLFFSCNVIKGLSFNTNRVNSTSVSAWKWSMFSLLQQCDTTSKKEW